MSRLIPTAAAVMFAIVLAGCGSESAPSAPSAPEPTAASSAATGPPPATTGVAVPDTLAFTTDTVGGGLFNGATLAGRPVVFWFWAAWCPRCRAAAGDVAAVERDFADRVHVVGVAGLDSGAAAMRTFVTDQGIGGFTNLADDEGEIWKRFGVTAQEYYVVLDAQGKIVHKGPMTPGGLRDRVTALAG